MECSKLYLTIHSQSPEVLSTVTMSFVCYSFWSAFPLQGWDIRNWWPNRPKSHHSHQARKNLLVTPKDQFCPQRSWSRWGPPSMPPLHQVGPRLPGTVEFTGTSSAEPFCFLHKHPFPWDSQAMPWPHILKITLQVRCSRPSKKQTPGFTD